MVDETTRTKMLIVGSSLLGVLALFVGFLLLGPEIDWGKTFRPPSGDGSSAAVRPEDDTERLYVLAERYARQGDTVYATALARRILYVDPRHIPARKFLAALALKQKNYAELRDWCKEILHLQPNDASAHLGLASAYAHLHQPKEAHETLQGVIRDRAYSPEERGAAQAALDTLDGKRTTGPTASLFSPE